MSIRRRELRFGVLALPLLAMAACGDTTTIPQVAGATPFAASTVTIHQAGNAPVTIDPASVTFKLDAARSLVATLDARSGATGAITVAMRGTVYDPKGNIVGDVTGGQVRVTPGSVTHVQLNGPTPLGTIASATFEVSVQPLPT